MLEMCTTLSTEKPTKSTGVTNISPKTPEKP